MVSAPSCSASVTSTVRAAAFVDAVILLWPEAGASCRSALLLPVIPYVDKSRHMESESTILALAALAQPTRLDTFRLLVKHEPEGVPAGEIARQLDVPHNTMSSHLNVLSRAGLVRSERHSRSIIYRAELDRFQGVIAYLLQDCCGGRPEVCAPLVDALAPCCSRQEKVNG
jgi:ArsR family transcriptional regulator